MGPTGALTVVVGCAVAVSSWWAVTCRCNALGWVLQPGCSGCALEQIMSAPAVPTARPSIGPTHTPAPATARSFGPPLD